MPHLQPIVTLDPKLLPVFIRLARLLPVRQSPDELGRMSVILKLTDPVLDRVPAGGLLRSVGPDFLQADVR